MSQKLGPYHRLQVLLTRFSQVQATASGQQRARKALPLDRIPGALPRTRATSRLATWEQSTAVPLLTLNSPRLVPRSTDLTRDLTCTSCSVVGFPFCALRLVGSNRCTMDILLCVSFMCSSQHGGGRGATFPPLRLSCHGGPWSPQEWLCVRQRSHVPHTRMHGAAVPVV